jgi:hypothetical protein
VVKIIKFEFLWNQKRVISILESILFSIILIQISSSFRILNPKYADWLSIGDGTAEISWEFFRTQPLIQFPLGLNPRYGLEFSSTVAFDGQIPLMSFIFHPFSKYLPERFQYIGIFLFFTFALNFYFAKKLFKFLRLNEYQALLCATILATSPVILNRYIESTHYALTSSWIIFGSMLLSLQSNIKLKAWLSLTISTVLIHLYFLPFVLLIYIFTNIFVISKSRVNLNTLKVPTLIILATIFVMTITGYFHGGVSGKDSGYGLFRSTLSSILDPSGWSKVLPDLSEPFGSYEGFAFIGIATMILIFLNILLIKFPKTRINQFEFKPLWISAVLLFLFSLSNKVALGNVELFDFPVPDRFSIITSTFRSSGRFIWLLVFLLFIYSVHLISRKVSGKGLSVVLTLILIANFADSYQQLTAQKSMKFNSSNIPSLKDIAWNSISQCYKNLRVYPPTVEVEDYYSFLNIAFENNLGINTGRFARFDQSAIFSAFDQMHKEFNDGMYREDSFYVFTNANGVLPEFVNYQKNLAVHTLNIDSAYGELDGYSFIAPNLNTCPEGNGLKGVALGFGAPKNQIYRGEVLSFGKNLDTSKYILIGFSALEDWGVWSVDEISKINLNTENISNFKFINITGRDMGLPANLYSVHINDIGIGTCVFEIEFTTCTIPFEFKNLQTNIVRLTFKPKIIRSPKDLGISDDTRNLGFGLKNISLS